MINSRNNLLKRFSIKGDKCLIREGKCLDIFRVSVVAALFLKID